MELKRLFKLEDILLHGLIAETPPVYYASWRAKLATVQAKIKYISYGNSNV